MKLRKSLAILLAALMLVSVLPTAVFADDDDDFFLIINGWLKIDNTVDAPDDFEKTEYTYEFYRESDGELLYSVTLGANETRAFPIIGNEDVLVVASDMEVEGYDLVTTCSEEDGVVTVTVPDTVTIDFTHEYTPTLNTADHYAYIIGYTDRTVRPNSELTRAELATILYRLLSTESRDIFYTDRNNYSDVDADAWYNVEVSTMTAAGVFNGYPDGSFKPDAPITRAELVSVMVTFFTEIEPVDPEFIDTVGHWADEIIEAAYAEGLIEGYDDGSFKPDQSVTRAEAIKVINVVLGRDLVAGELCDDMIVWKDNMDTDAWYYYAIQEATNSHTYLITDHESWTGIIDIPVEDEVDVENEAYETAVEDEASVEDTADNTAAEDDAETEADA